MKTIENIYSFDAKPGLWKVEIVNPRWPKSRYFHIDDPSHYVAKEHTWSIRITRGFKEVYCTCHKESLSRLIMKAKDGEIVDVINNDRLDLRRDNLRIATTHQDRWNSRPRKSKIDIGVAGVEFKFGKWEARIKKNGTWHYLGRYDHLYDAVCCRVRNEYIMFGEYDLNYRKILKHIPRYYLLKWLPEIYSHKAIEFVGSDIYRAHYKNKEAGPKQVKAMKHAGRIHGS